MPIVTTVNQNKQKKSINQHEINHFDQLAEKWWDRKGPMSALHDMNALRVEWINQILKQYPENYRSETLLDIGCGAGLASEALASLGYNVMGVDAGEKVIQAARHHLQTTPLPPKSGILEYQVGDIETLIHNNERFSVITALELMEHVNNPAEFVKNLSKLLQPTGLVFISTINRTFQSFLFAKVAAEYIARKLPVGTHNWKQFIPPAELGDMANQAGLRTKSMAGLTYYPNGWKLTRNVQINYIACFSKA